VLEGVLQLRLFAFLLLIEDLFKLIDEVVVLLFSMWHLEAVLRDGS
jgi:hypothetical protein